VRSFKQLDFRLKIYETDAHTDVLMNAVWLGSTHDPTIMGCQGLCSTLSAVCPDISTREQVARPFCRFYCWFV